MKAKTKRRIRHVLTKKKLVKKKTSRHLMRAFVVLLATASMGSLAYAIAVTKPSVNIAVHSSGPDGKTLSAPATSAAPTPAPKGSSQSGRASWYALGLPQPDAITCASRTFPRGSHLLVKNLYNGNTVTCLVNDYGPEAWTGRVLDLSRGSFRQVDSLGRGTIPVEITMANGQSSRNTLTLPIREDIAAVIGYNLCNRRYTPEYCEAHRQD